MTDATDVLQPSPFHAGERAIQKRLGVSERMEQKARQVIRDHMPDQHRELAHKLPFVIAGSVDGDNQPWASILVGEPGFMSTPDAHTLKVAATAIAGDPLQDNVRRDSPLGILFIQPETRRRNRLNGTVAHRDEDGFIMDVGQSFGNCPQYIQARRHSFVQMPDNAKHENRPVQFGRQLDADALKLIRGADTFFIATSGQSRACESIDTANGVDVSHRGGKPGFIRIEEADGQTVLTVPDFIGNFHFNTFGNLQLNPKAGLLLVDFETGDLLQLAGTADVIWEGPEVSTFTGAERLLQFRLDKGQLIRAGIPLRFSEPEYARELPRTGSWEAAAEAQKASEQKRTYRPFRVTEMVDESETVRSFTLEPDGGGGLATYQAGQYLPIEIEVTGQAKPLRRTYTISQAPNGRNYRISVKREVKANNDVPSVSNWLHDNIAVGSIIRALPPRGHFKLNGESVRPVVLLSGGIGVTPNIAMLQHLLVGNDERTRSPDRKVWFIHAARHSGEHAFRDYVAGIAARRPQLTTHVRYAEPRPDDKQGEHFDDRGFLDADALRMLLPLDDYDVYLCGPPGFMQAMYDALLSLGVPDERIRFEAFGPATVERRKPAEPPAESAVGSATTSAGVDTSSVAAPAAVTSAITTPSVVTPPVVRADVSLKASGKSEQWTEKDGPILEFAEALGAQPAFSCRSGDCGTCAVKLLSGEVSYMFEPSAEIADGEVLICCSVPASENVSVDA